MQTPRLDIAFRIHKRLYWSLVVCLPGFTAAQQNRPILSNDQTMKELSAILKEKYGNSGAGRCALSGLRSLNAKN
jgi:hypothetical protein